MTDGFNPWSRRRFLQGTTATAASLSALSWTRLARGQGAGDKVLLGMIGCGGIAQSHWEQIEKIPGFEVIAVCDIDDKHGAAMADKAEKKYGKRPAVLKDFRKLLENKDIQAVTVGTPDHWHALCLIHACEAGKDVYCEKPLSYSVVEGRAMVKTAEKTKRVVQIGTQQRSAKHYQEAIELIRSGGIGRVSAVETWNHYNREGMGNPPDGEPPAGVDYDMWLGPAPKRAFNQNRFHGKWRYFRDYGGGYVTDWNTHHQDIVHLAMNVSAPKSAVMDGFIVNADNDNRDMPDTATATFEYDAPQGAFLSTYSIRCNSWRSVDFNQKHADHGIVFFGKKATLVITRAGYDLYSESKEPLKTVAGEAQMLPHFQDYLDRIKDRGKTRSDIESVHKATVPNHVANMAWRVGRKLYWDDKTEKAFMDPQLKTPDKDANKLLFRQPRAPWKIPT